MMHRKGVKAHTPPTDSRAHPTAVDGLMGRHKQRSGNEEHSVRREGPRNTPQAPPQPWPREHAALAGNFGSERLWHKRSGGCAHRNAAEPGAGGTQVWHHELDSSRDRPLGDPIEDRVNSSDTLLSAELTGTGKNNSRP